MDTLTQEQRDIIEADSFWCLSKFLDGIQDNYVFAQLGIQKKVNQLKDLIKRIDGKNTDFYKPKIKIEFCVISSTASPTFD